MTFAIVPACGHSTRMGRAKLDLPLGDRTVIEHVVITLRESGVERVLVVVGPHVPKLIPLAIGAGADVLALPEPTADMRKTVEHGLNWMEERHHPEPTAWWVLTPGDSPAIAPAVIRQLFATADDSCSVVVPVYEGHRGHPVLLRWRHVAGIRSASLDESINVYLRHQAAVTREVSVTDPGVLADLNTPEDYTRFSAPILSASPSVR